MAYASGEIPVDEDGKNLEEAQAIAEQLREHGGDVNLFPDKGEPLLITTCREYTAQNRSWMIAFGADPTIAAANGDTTVEIAAAVISQHAFGLHPGFTYFDLFGKLKEMAGQGNVRAQGMLGYAYLTGVGTDQAPMEGRVSSAPPPMPMMPSLRQRLAFLLSMVPVSSRRIPLRPCAG